MTNRPVRSIEPLPPPPGRFDQVMREARTRRYRRATAVTGVAGVFLAGIMGGLALGGLGEVPERITAIAGLNGPSSASPTSQGPPSSASRTPETTTASNKSGGPSHSNAPSQAPQHVAVVRGHVVDSGGAPVPGVYVYTSARDDDFVPHELPAARTGATGNFSIPCQGPVLLTPWPLNHPMRSIPESRVAATMIDAPVCSRVQKAEVMRMDSGGTIEGQVRTDVGCAGEDFRAALWLDGSRAASLRLAHLHEGDAFRLTGIPEGTHKLRVNGKGYDVAVPSSAATVTRNVTVTCPDLPTPTEVPSLTPSPASTPSETQSPSPSETTTAPASPTSTESTPKN